MVSFSLLGLQHPEPNGSRRATPTSTFQHRPGHLPGSVAPGKVGGLSQERTIDALWRTVGRLLDRFNPEECRNDFENSGYASN